MFWTGQTTEIPGFAQPIKGHDRHVTNPVLQDPASIQLVSPATRETPSLELALSLARIEVRLAPNALTRLRSLRHEADLILRLTAALAEKLTP
jgi:hypothetical protein